MPKRTGDIGNVGVTAYHHTFFEMLGNFSFGDYFKREAIHWAWEFLTSEKWLGLSPGSASRPPSISMTMRPGTSGSRRSACPRNGFAARTSTRTSGRPERPVRDRTEYAVRAARSTITRRQGGSEVEIWNLVFTQFNRVGDPPDNLRPLPKQNIDTGMGLERTAAVLQGVESNFEIDTLRPLCEAAGDVVGVKYDIRWRAWPGTATDCRPYADRHHVRSRERRAEQREAGVRGAAAVAAGAARRLSDRASGAVSA